MKKLLYRPPDRVQDAPLVFEVIALEKRVVIDRTEVLITPVAGTGQRWTRLERLQRVQAPQPPEGTQ